MILIEKQQKYRHYHLGNLINMNLTDEEILTSDQIRIIKQAKFTYSPLGKASEKQIKTIEDQAEKQLKALEEHENHLAKYSDEKEPLTNSKQKNFFEELANRRMEEIQNLSKQINFNNLIYYFKGKSTPKNL